MCHIQLSLWSYEFTENHFKHIDLPQPHFALEVHAVPSLYHKSGFVCLFVCLFLTAETHSWPMHHEWDRVENSEIYITRLREHFGRGGRQNARAEVVEMWRKKVTFWMWHSHCTHQLLDAIGDLSKICTRLDPSTFHHGLESISWGSTFLECLFTTMSYWCRCIFYWYRGRAKIHYICSTQYHPPASCNS